MRANRVKGEAAKRGADGVGRWMLALAGAGALGGEAMGQHATSVVSYLAGAGTASGYTDAQGALGEPTRFMAGEFGGAVTPFNAPWMAEHVVQVGRGGSLVVEFSTAITNDAWHPYGVDFIVFGNAFYGDASWPSGVADGSLAAEGGDVDVSADGVNWHRVATSAADGRFPTLGYLDLAGAYSANPGAVLSDFTRAVDPAFTVSAGMTFAQIAAGYAGSGGGVGIDIASSGLSSVRYVRVSVAEGAAFVPEIDGFAVVPGAPGCVAMALAGAVGLRRRR